MGLLDFLNPKPKLQPKTPPKYRIDSHPEWGFCGLVREEFGWHPLHTDGTSGPRDWQKRDVWREDYWCATDDEAGQRINAHATNHGIKTVWSA